MVRALTTREPRGNKTKNSDSDSCLLIPLPDLRTTGHHVLPLGMGARRSLPASNHFPTSANRKKASQAILPRHRESPLRNFPVEDSGSRKLRYSTSDPTCQRRRTKIPRAAASLSHPPEE